MDIAQKETEALLRKLEKELSDVYKQAVEETEQKIDEYFRKFAYLDLKKRQMVARGELTQEDYAKWRLGKVLIGERWHEMRDTLAKDLVATDKIAYSMVEGYMPEVYALNHNYSTFRVEGISGIDTSYSLYSRETVERLWRDNPSLLYAPGVNVAKDMAWNKKHIQGELTQAILQGEDIRKLSKRIERVVGMDETSARRNARTMITSAQNGGRVDAFTRAKVEYGIDVMNEWLATMDNRVRHSHAVLDGERREIGKAFSNGCKYPGDLSNPNVAPSEVYNCRCTLIPYLPKYTDSDWRENNAEYDEWKAMHRKALEEKQKKEKSSDNGHDRAVAEKPVVVTKVTKESKNGKAVSEAMVKDETIKFTGITSEDWMNWAEDPEIFQSALLGENMPSISNADGHRYTQAEKDRAKKVALEIQRLAEEGTVNQETLYRGESFESLAEAKKKYKIGKTITNNKLTSYATKEDIAEEYAGGSIEFMGEGAVKVIISNTNLDGVSVGVITDPFGIGGSDEVISPKGLKSYVMDTHYDNASNTLYVYLGNSAKPKKRKRGS